MATPTFLIGIDIGTSSTKGVIMDATGQMRASAGQEYPIHTLKPGWAEQDPDIWVTTA
jgi:sugar (pentulose or hexulose) kinase